MAQQIPVSSSAEAEHPSLDKQRDDSTHEIAPDLAYRRLGIANVVFFGAPGASDRGWVLIDTGMPGLKGMITGAAEQRFGPNSRPAAIILTHGHFDHVGAVVDLAREWEAPVFAHSLERPYLDGSSAYPPPDPAVGGGMMAMLSPLYPKKPVDLGAALADLPADGSVPHMPGWRWLHTPGHSVGHVSLFRPADRSMIVGDAFVTIAAESAYANLVGESELHGPPMYFTVDWEKSAQSVRTLAALEPELVITGHGKAMQGPDMRQALHTLADNFEEVAVPKQGKYVAASARASDDTAYPKP